MVFDAIPTLSTHELGDEGARILVANTKVLGKPLKAPTLLELKAVSLENR